MNYPDVKWQFRPGELNQERLEGVAESSNEIAVGQTLLSTQPYIYTVTNATADAVRVRLSWPNLQAQDSSGNINGVRIEYAIDVATDGAPYQTVLSTFVDRKNVTTYYRSHRINLPAGGHWAVRVRRISVPSSAWIGVPSSLIDLSPLTGPTIGPQLRRYTIRAVDSDATPFWAMCGCFGLELPPLLPRKG